MKDYEEMVRKREEEKRQARLARKAAKREAPPKQLLATTTSQDVADELLSTVDLPPTSEILPTDTEPRNIATPMSNISDLPLEGEFLVVHVPST